MIPLIIIPARGGSKRHPGKNIKLLKGKPLIYYTIETARKVFEDQYIYVSTDSLEIKHITEKSGLKVPFLRPDNLATDIANSRDVILHAMNQFKLVNKNKDPEIIVLLQPTSPMRNALHIEEALKLYTNDLDMVVSVKKTNVNPYDVLFEENEDGFLRKFIERNSIQIKDCKTFWKKNGAIYIINPVSIRDKPIEKFEKVIKYEMDYLSSIDIDTNSDWENAQSHLKNLYK